MFSLLLKLKRMVTRLLKVQSAARQKATTTPRSRVVKLAMLVVMSVLVALLYPGESIFDPLNMPRKGDISVDDIIAPFKIDVYRTDREIRDERKAIQLTVPYVADVDTMVIEESVSSLNTYLALADSVRMALAPGDSDAEERAYQFLSASFPRMSARAIRESIRRESMKEIGERLETIYRDDIYAVGVLSDVDSLPEGGSRNVLVRRGNRENIYSRDRLIHTAQANGQLLTALNRLYSTDSIDVEYFYLVGKTFIRPDVIVNDQAYSVRLEADLSQLSEIKETVAKDDIITRSGSRVTQRQERILQAMANTLRKTAESDGWIQQMAPAVVRILLVLTMFSMLYLFIACFRREIFNSNPRMFALLLIFALQLLFTYLVGNQWELSIYMYPVAMLPVMVTILIDAEIGILSTVVLALLLGIIDRFNFTLVAMTIMVGTAAGLSSRKVRRRTDFLRIMVTIALAYAVFIFLIEEFKMTPEVEILTVVGYGFLNGIICGILAVGLLPVFESLFGITTDITLLELSDLNHPLLKRLAIEAPGTYHHSMLVGNLNEAAAKAIGGNSLLARVGAYYHDIGKMEVPEYFVENQLGTTSRHDALTPSMSALVIASHVKKGRVLGEEADIPDDILNFIEEHHGTMIQTYFYNKAIEQYGDSVDPNKYRYPGPRPQTRETGIAMLADAVEASSRTLEDPKPARINGLIQRIIDDRFQSGELNECPLTLRDLARIKEAFAQVLMGVFHQRIAYPKKKTSSQTDVA